VIQKVSSLSIPGNRELCGIPPVSLIISIKGFSQMVLTEMASGKGEVIRLLEKKINPPLKLRIKKLDLALLPSFSHPVLEDAEICRQ
jgi:hypothetical protein